MTTLASLALALSVAQAPAASQPPAAVQAAPPELGIVKPAAAPATTLTLDEALRLAEERNLDLKAVAARLRQAEQGYWKALSGYLPRLTASGTYVYNHYDFEIPAGAFGPDPIPIVPKDQLSGQVEATQVLFSPALWFSIQAASRGEDAARAATENARRSIVFGAAQAYYGVAALRQQTLVTERLLEIAQRQEKDARVRYQAGAVAKVGLLRAEIDRARAEQDLLRARNSYQSARLALATLLDRPADFDIADPPEPAVPADPAKLQEAALRDRADVQSARSARDAAIAARRAQLARYAPTLAGFGRYQVSNVASFSPREDQWSAGLVLQWTLLDGGLREAEIREGGAKVDEADATLASAEARVRLEVQQALLDLESARANATKAREQRELAAENQRLVDVSFRAGSATAVEQADAIAQLRTAEIAQTAEALGAQLAALRVLQTAGAKLR